MFRKPKKEIFVLRRVLFSIFATTAVLIIASASILFMLGYRLDSGNGRLEQGALLQFDSKPGAADIWIDGTALGSQTAAKQIVLAGTHSITFAKKGYEDWSRTLTLESGTLTWLDYARLVPTDRSVTSVLNYQTLAGLTFSPDKKWAVALETPSTPFFKLIDLRSEQVRSSDVVLPTSLYTRQGESEFSMARWNTEGRYMIMKHVYGDNQTEWLMIDTQDVAKSVNITRLLSVDLVDVQFTGTSGTSVYGFMADATIRKLDLASATISRILVTNVSRFSVFADTGTISYVGVNPEDASQQVAGIYKDGGVEPTVLRRTNTPDAQLSIALGRYFNETFVAITQNDTVTVLTGALPSDGQADSGSLRTHDTFKITGSGLRASFSEEGDFLVILSDTHMTGYEVEHKRKGASVSFGTDATRDSLGNTPKWLDPAHLWFTNKDQLIMRDFDSSNSYSIMKVAPGYDASLSTNGRFFYSVGRDADGGYQLQRVRMIL